MMKLMVVHASLDHSNSTSRFIANSLAQRLSETFSQNSVHVRDLSVEKPEHWGAAQVQAAFTEKHKRSALQKGALSKSDLYCEELMSCTHLIISSPMWNFSIPSVLKAWIDHIVRVDLTFKYGLGKPEGLVKNLEKVFIVESAGGTYEGRDASLNHVGPYLESVFKFLGAQDVHLISAHGTAAGNKDAINRALKQIENLAL